MHGWKENDIADQLVAAECAAKMMQASFFFGGGGGGGYPANEKMEVLCPHKNNASIWQSKYLQNYEELK